MSFVYEAERQEFVKVATEVPVRYKFLSRSIDLSDESIYEGTTSRISGKGLLLLGKLPSASWIPALLTGKIILGLNILLPNADVPVKVLTRVAWVEAFPEGSEKCAMGLTFKEITKEHQDTIMKYIIRAQIRK